MRCIIGCKVEYKIIYPSYIFLPIYTWGSVMLQRGDVDRLIPKTLAYYKSVNTVYSKQTVHL